VAAVARRPINRLLCPARPHGTIQSPVKTAITARTLYTPLERIENPVVVCEDGWIAAVFSRDQQSLPANAELLDFPDAVLAPGLIDIHIHGGAGHDVMSADRSGFAALGAQLEAHGVTAYYPTTVTASLDETLRALERLANEIEAPQGNGAEPLGIHLEGPFISHAKRGVHPPENLLEPSVTVFERFWQAARGHVAILTIAPELPNAEAVVREAASRGICVSLGHSDSELGPAQAAIRAGARHATHTFNAMRPLDHRQPGILGAVLTDDQVSADIIADGVHVHPETLKIFFRAKGPERALLITDAISATGMGEGRFRLGGFEVEVRGETCLHQGKLAGSVLTLDRAIQNVMRFAGWELGPALRLATMNPARTVRDSSRGEVVPGAVADLIALSATGEVIATIKNGRLPSR